MGVEGVPASGSVWRVPGMPWLLASAMLWFAGFALLVPVAPLWVIRGGSDDLGAGLVTGVMMACTVLAQLSMRRLLAGLGWRWTLVLGAGLLGLPALGHLVTDRLWPVIALAALRGLGFGIVTVCGASAVAAFVEPGRRGRALGALGLAIAAPQFIGVPAAPWLAERAGFGLVFMLAVLPALAIPLAWPIARAVGDREREPDVRSGADGYEHRAAAALGRVLAGPIAALIVITASGGAILTFTTRILVSPALGFAGLLAFTGAAAVSRWGAGGIADRFGATAAIAPLLFTGALGLAAIGLRADSAHDGAGRVLVIAGLLVVGVAYGGLQNLTLTQAFAAAGEPARDTVSVAWNLSFDAGTGLGAFVVGAIATATSYSVAFGVLAVTAALAGVGWAVPGLARRRLPGPVAVPAAVVVAVLISGAAVVPVLAAAAAARLLLAAAGEQGRPDAGDRLGPGLGQQGGRRLLGALAAAGHPGRDEAGHDRGRERRAAPLRDALEPPRLPRERGDPAGERAGGERVDQVLAGCVHVDPAAEVAEVREAAQVGPERADRDHSRERGRPVR
jgi:predicted MFS family arabinose efflux permease